MDIVQQCLSLVPVPYLAHTFNVLRFILSSVEQVQASKQQLHALAQTAAQLLSTLNQEYHAGRLVHTETSAAVADLDRFVVMTREFGLLTASIMQIARRGLNVRSEGGLAPILDAPFHQRSEDRSDRSIPQAYRHCSRLISGKLSYPPLSY